MRLSPAARPTNPRPSSISPATKTQRRGIAFAALCAVLLWVDGCAYQPASYGHNLPGFWLGLLHGFLILFSFIGSLLTNVRIYAFPNAGHWYDFGYVLGAMTFLGGSGASRR
jgi:hypothetical protein